MVELKAEEGDFERWLFDPAGLLLAGIVGSVGVISLLRQSWILGVLCVILATLGLIAPHRHFDPNSELVPRVAKRKRLHVPVTFLREVRCHNLFPTRRISKYLRQDLKFHRIARAVEFH